MTVQRKRNNNHSRQYNNGGRSYNKNSHGKKTFNAKMMYEKCLTQAKEIRGRQDDAAEDLFQRAEHFGRILQKNNQQSNSITPEKVTDEKNESNISKQQSSNSASSHSKHVPTTPTHSTKKRYSRSTTPINEEKKDDTPKTDGQKLFGE